MKNLVRLVLLVLLAALGVWLWNFFFPSPKTVIRGRLVKLARLTSFTPREGHIAAVANVERMGPFFADEIQITIDTPGIEPVSFTRRDELLQAAMAARSSGVGDVKVSLEDINVSLAPDGQSATADLTLRAKLSTQKDPAFQELKVTFKKVDRNWLISGVETVKPLK